MRAYRSIDLSLPGGMVNIPGQVFTIQVGRQGRGLKTFCPECHGKIRERNFCESCGTTYHTKIDPYQEAGSKTTEDILHGEYVGKDVVIVGKEELANIAPESSAKVSIEYFAPMENLSRSLPLFVEKVYLWRPAPLKRGRQVLDNTHLRKAGALTLRAMFLQRVVGVGKVCLSRNREHVCLVKPEQGVLVLLLLRYETEVRLGDLEEAQEDYEDIKNTDQEIKAGVNLIKDYTKKKLGDELLRDAYAENLGKLIEAKAKGGKFEAPKPVRAEPAIDLVEALKASMKVAPQIPA